MYIRKRLSYSKISRLLLTDSAHYKKDVSAIAGKMTEEPFFSGMILLDSKAERGAVLDGISVVADRDSFLDYVTLHWVDEVYLILPNATDYRQELQQLCLTGVTLHTVPQCEELFLDTEYQLLHRTVNGVQILTVCLNSISGLAYQCKRAMDFFAGLFGSVMALIVILIFGPIIYIKSPGPVLFRQKRVGRNGKVFVMYKLRSMVMNAEAAKDELRSHNRVKDGMMFKLDYDPRIIGAKKLEDGTVKKGIGNFIRDYSIDEFPQFFNVLMGSMSLVGTRPPTLDEWEKYKPHHKARLAFLPGLTGVWQTRGRSEITDFEKVVEMDVDYIRQWRIGLDLKLIFRTVYVTLHKNGAM